MRALRLHPAANARFSMTRFRLRPLVALVASAWLSFGLPAHAQEEAKAIPQVCHSLDMALDALDADRDFLTAGGVFTDDLIDGYIDLKMQDVTRVRMTTHPVEFDMYYSS